MPEPGKTGNKRNIPVYPYLPMWKRDLLFGKSQKGYSGLYDIAIQAKMTAEAACKRDILVYMT